MKVIRVIIDMYIVVRKYKNVDVWFEEGFLFLLLVFLLVVLGGKIRMVNICVIVGSMFVIFCLVIKVCIYFDFLKFVVNVNVLFWINLVVIVDVVII